ncbi:hypothetical protein [Enhygromyxa salina]|uniref:Uncharacterized protein n=1 Tax=Enhygromyxa salina TaxID=215803 RepID=A0A2S9YS24_9BACT|nr:hypothetical protein [Enhygromyxa salina]PRQ07897.1 hypothetical protein ENSA7_23360 [Enhygromyxa salina]
MPEAPWIDSKVWHKTAVVVPGRRLLVLLPPRLAAVRPTEVTLPPTGQTTVRARFDPPLSFSALCFSELVLEAQVSWTHFDRSSFASHRYWVMSGVLAAPGRVRLPSRLGRAHAAAKPVGFTAWGAANRFTPSRDFSWRGLPFAADHGVQLSRDRGVLAGSISIGGVELERGTTVDSDPDDGSVLEARLARPMIVYGHDVPEDALVVVHRGVSPRAVTVITPTGCSVIQPDGTRG